MEEGDVLHEIEWTGWYEQFGKKHDVSFQDMGMNPEGKIEGGGKDSVGEFIITGNINDNDIQFNKAYKGAHTVKYSGKIENAIISGKWEITGITGAFEISMKTKHWKGSFEHNGQSYEMLASIDIKVIKGRRWPLRGVGGDSKGNYSLIGFQPICGDHNTVMFTKKYFNSPSLVHYSGIIGKFGGNEVIKGSWIMGTEFGTFELIKQA